MYNYSLHQQVTDSIKEAGVNIAGEDEQFYTRFSANAAAIFDLYMELYEHHPQAETHFKQLLVTITTAWQNRPAVMKQRDEEKLRKEYWFLSNELAGMSLYTDRFCGDIENLAGKLEYFEQLGVNLLHLMPVFESPPLESDGGYAVSNFRKVDDRFGTLQQLRNLQKEMQQRNMYLMLDIVLNHTSHHHEWAQKAKAGDARYQDYYYFFRDRSLPDQYDQTMPEVFPESAPGNFTWIPECSKYVMTVFHNYQWDLNYNNPQVLTEMLDTVFFYANLGVDLLRIDAPAFIWKQLGTTCQNLPQAHSILKLIKQCVQVATPGMALLGEAIVAPKEIMNYFGTGEFKAKECDFAYNATHMALQWDMLATGDTRVMLAAQHELLRKPYGTSWITYTRCHDDIGLGYDDYMIAQAGFSPYGHRKFIKEYYSGQYEGSPAKGALFSVNPKTQDARISGSLASLCGLEKALEEKDDAAVTTAINKIVLMQAHSFFLGGTPMLFYGDEAGYTNDYSYLQDEGKSYDNRWMHRPVIDWAKNKLTAKKGRPEYEIFTATKKLLLLRRQLPMVGDYSNLTWLAPHNIHVAGYFREWNGQRLYCIFNFSAQEASLTWYALKEHDLKPATLFDHWGQTRHAVGNDHEFFILPPYGFALLEAEN
jgi:amylosucrase